MTLILSAGAFVVWIKGTVPPSVWLAAEQVRHDVEDMIASAAGRPAAVDSSAQPTMPETPRNPVSPPTARGQTPIATESTSPRLPPKPSPYPTDGVEAPVDSNSPPAREAAPLELTQGQPASDVVPPGGGPVVGASGPPAGASRDRTMERAQTPSPDQNRPAGRVGFIADSGAWRSIVLGQGSTVSAITRDFYGPEVYFLAFDLVKEANPQIDNLNWVLAGQRLRLPPISRSSLLRPQSDGSYRIVLTTMSSVAESERLAAAARTQGYRTVVIPRSVTSDLMLYRVEIEGLADQNAASRAWDMAVARSWGPLRGHR
jgi:hypothetical protein